MKRLLVIVALGWSATSGRAFADAPQPAASSNAEITAPAHNWVLPLFTPTGFRSETLRGNEARMTTKDRIDVKEINITVFSSDAKTTITTSVLSTEASYFPSLNFAKGPGMVHIIHYVDGTDASGEDWTYDFKQEKVSLRHNVRVEFAQALNDPLK